MLRQGDVRNTPSGWEVWDDVTQLWLTEDLLAERAPRLLKAMYAAKAINPNRHEWRLDAQEQHLKDIPVQGQPEKPYRSIRVYDDAICDAHGMRLGVAQLAALVEFANALAIAAQRSTELDAVLDPAKPMAMRVPRGTNWV